MTIYKLVWKKINWGNYYAQGYNYVEGQGTIYTTTKELAMEKCPIKANEGSIMIQPIYVEEN